MNQFIFIKYEHSKDWEVIRVQVSFYKICLLLEKELKDMYTENYDINESNWRKYEEANGKIAHVHELEEYCQNVDTTWSNLQIQWNSYQNSNDIVPRYRKKLS